MPQPLSAVFVNYAADVLADTELGLSGSAIVKVTVAHAIEHNLTIPHSKYPFEAANKRTALAENLMAYPELLRYLVIRELCDHPLILERNKQAGHKLKLQLVRYHRQSRWLVV